MLRHLVDPLVQNRRGQLHAPARASPHLAAQHRRRLAARHTAVASSSAFGTTMTTVQITVSEGSGFHTTQHSRLQSDSGSGSSPSTASGHSVVVSAPPV
eukprot:1219525-Rhodomonas_salina.1